MAENHNSLIGRAITAHRAGNLSQAESLYNLILSNDGKQFDALHMLGVLAGQSGNFDKAERFIRSALGVDPASFEAHTNHARVLLELKRYDEALSAADTALSFNRNHVNAHLLRGSALLLLRRAEAALQSFDRALALKPDFIMALFNRGEALSQLKRFDEALLAYNKALAMKPDYADALAGIGNVFCERKDLDRASAAYDKALAIKPGREEAWIGRGKIYFERRDFDKALAAYDQAIALKPNSATAFYGRGTVLHAAGQSEEARASYEQTIVLEPEYFEARFALCMAELPILYESVAEIAERRAAYEQRVRALCEIGDCIADLPALARAVGSSQPFYLTYQGHDDRDLQALYGSFVCRIMAERYPPAPPVLAPGDGEPVRVGIVSGFFREHSNWKAPIKGWLSQLDPRRFRIFGYHTGGWVDAETKTGAALCDRFIQGPLSIDRWRAEILADAPHVLIYPEVGMDSAAAALAAQRLAAVQCNSWGHPDTSGFPTLDYYLSSDLMEPSNAQDHYTEELIRLPNLSIYCEPIDAPLAPMDGQAFGFHPTATVYWCGQSLYKYLPQFDSVFPRIAREAGDSKFVFICNDARAITQSFRQRLDRAFGAFDLKAADHCLFLPRLDQREFLAAAGRCDVFLDSIQWSGCNSTLESLPYDLPIVTMRGALMRGRHSMAILEMMGVTGTIADTVDDYVSIAVRLARDTSWRASVKAGISTNKHRIYRDSACIAALEQFLDRVARGRNPHD